MKRTKTIQKEIAEAIKKYCIKSDKIMEYEADSRYSAFKSMLYSFHDNKTIAVDGTLYDILVHGHGDFNYGNDLSVKIHKIVHDAGYYLEYEGQGIFNIVEA